MVYCLDYSMQGSTLQNNYHTAIWLSSRLHNLSKKLHYLTEGLHYHNKVNLKGTLLDMNYIIQSMNIITPDMLRWVLMQLQKSTFAVSINAWILAV